jgi:hypothetical protein
MNIDTFFRHWGLEENPFQAEEARDDPVYHRIMIEDMSHPDFDKIYGSPVRPSTAVVFGEKGSGKTAIRLLIERRLQQHNEKTPDCMNWVVNYDSLNPILDRIERSKAGAASDLSDLRLEDHQDAILSLAVTKMVDFLVGGDDLELKDARRVRKNIRKMSRQKRLDLAQLVALYDQPTKTNALSRWGRVKNFLRIGKVFNANVFFWMSVIFLTIAVASGVAIMFNPDALSILACIISGALFLFSSVFFISESIRVGGLVKKLEREIRVVGRQSGELKRKIADLAGRELTTQPMPVPGDQDSRYELTTRFMRVANEMGYRCMTVLVDRVDEPVAVNGDPERMKNIIWPMLQNKFLQQDSVGFKMLLPIELSHLLRKEGPDFFLHARLDKQNMIERLQWTGATLYDISSRRVKACAGNEGKFERLTDFFEDDITSQDLMDALDQMSQPRDAFKFLYGVIQEHCSNTNDDTPQFKIPKLVLDQIRKQQSQRVQDLHRGLRPA